MTSARPPVMERGPRRPVGRPARILVACLAGVSGGVTFAHEKWFFDAEGYRADLGAAMTPPNLYFVLAPVLLTLLAAAWWLGRGRRGLLPGPAAFGADGERRSALYGVLPAIVAAHLAVPLLVSGVQGTLFAPNNVLSGAWPYVLGVVQIGVALSLFYGGFARAAAVLLALSWLAGFVAVGPVGMLETVHFLGFAGFFYLAGRGPIAIDRLLFPRLEPSRRAMAWALPALRGGVGASLIVLAFTEKLANLPLAVDFLQEYPINLAAAVGVPLPDAWFMLTAGAIELTVGTFLLFGLFPREVILLAWLPFNLTLAVFDWVELVGHLPIYGVMAVLLVWEGSVAEQRLWLRGLRGGPLPVRDA